MEDLVLLGKINEDGTVSAIPCSWSTGYISAEGELKDLVKEGAEEPLILTLLDLSTEGYRQKDWDKIIEYNKEKDPKFVEYAFKNMQEYGKKLCDYEYLFVFYQGHCFMKSRSWVPERLYWFLLEKTPDKNKKFIRSENWRTPEEYAALIEEGVFEELPWSDLSQWFKALPSDNKGETVS